MLAQSLVFTTRLEATYFRLIHLVKTPRKDDMVIVSLAVVTLSPVFL